MAETFPLSDQTYSKQKISILQHFLTTMFCKKKLPRMLVPQNAPCPGMLEITTQSLNFSLGLQDQKGPVATLE